uniref:acyl-CoA dehydrogenase family protein n=1 Tax=uncultured Aurantimicrobium sp. TaxID=1705357 RepID=UPI00260CB67B
PHHIVKPLAAMGAFRYGYDETREFENSAIFRGFATLEVARVDASVGTFVGVHSGLAMGSVALCGSIAQREEWLPKMASGDVIGCFAMTEPEHGSDVAGGMATTARREGDEWVLNGAKRWIGLATLADICILWAMTDEGVRGFIVPTDTPGFTATAIEGKLSMRASIQCDIELTNVVLPADALLPNAKGLSGPFGCLNEARYGIIWGAMGAARACLDAAITRSKDREVFGKPIGSFQLTQAKLADMTLEYEKGVLLALHIGRQKDAGTLNIAQISVGKLNSVREALKIAREARTILGGDGITGEFPVMRHMANLESVRTYEGTDEIHQLVIGRALTGLNAFS